MKNNKYVQLSSPEFKKAVGRISKNLILDFEKTNKKIDLLAKSSESTFKLFDFIIIVFAVVRKDIPVDSFILYMYLFFRLINIYFLFLRHTLAFFINRLSKL